MPSVRQFRYWSLGGGGDCHCNMYTKPVPGAVCETVQVLVSGGGGGDCHCNRYTKPVPGDICETVQVLVSGGGGDCHCNRYTKPVPGAICETVQVLVSGGGGVIVIVTVIPSRYLMTSVRQFRYWSLGGGG